MEPETIADLAAGNEDLEILTAALEATGLDAAVADPDADLTVFAPTDAAFGALAVDLGFTGDVADEDAVFAFLATLGTETLSTVLLYHVLGASEDLASLSAGDARETLQGGSVVVGGGFVFDADADDLASAAVIEGLSDVAASNGIVQVVDRVLRPVDLPQAEEPAFESIAAAAVALSTTEGFDDDTGDFDVLLAALEATGLTAAVADTSATLTVAAPTDQAFIDLAVALGATPADEAEAFAAIASALDDLDGDAGDGLGLLADVLLYHVYAGAFGRADLASGPILTTAAGGVGPLTNARTLADADGGLADPAFIDAASDIVTGNGVIQAIDAVLLPLSVTGTAAPGIVSGTEGDDALALADDTVRVDAGAGTDALTVGAALDAASLGYTEGGFTIGLDDREIDAIGVESFVFDDATVVVDGSADAQSVGALYLGGLGRLPDFGGQGFWTGVAGASGVDAVADAFVDSAEFVARFGTSEASPELVDAFYETVLGREADEAGSAFWNDAIAAGADASDLLLAFATGPEFLAGDGAVFDDGVLSFA